MTHPLFRHAEFYTTVNRLQDLPPATGIEVAFAGRSNAGKSSAINTLVGRGRFAFVSKTPGRTQHINFFQLAESRFMVDLPGYGYAQVPQAVREHWVHLLSSYLKTRQSLYGMILIMDIRHPLTKLDLQMLDWFRQTGKPVHTLLTKADKLSKTRVRETLNEVRQLLSANYPHCTAQTFSSLKAEGVEEVSQLLQSWFDAAYASAPQESNSKINDQKKPPAKGD